MKANSKEIKVNEKIPHGKNIKMTTLTKLVPRFVTNTLQNSRFLGVGGRAQIDKVILKFILNCKALQRGKTTLKKNKIGRLIFSDFKTYYKATLIKTGWYGHKNKTDQWRIQK